MTKDIQNKINKLSVNQQSIAHLAYKAGYAECASNLPESYDGRELPQNEEASELWNHFWSEGNGELAAAEANHSALDY